MTSRKPFLTAKWNYLAMFNYEVDADILQPYLPRGTELDSFDGRDFASLVGFLFLDTKVKGIPIPFHRNFEEVNLRFYVRRRVDQQWRRGVVFVKEIVPRSAIAWVARTVYGENYVRMPMRHELDTDGAAKRVAYEWKFGGRWQRMAAEFESDPIELENDSEQQFIAEHYYGYAAQRDGKSKEYEVAHPSWRVWNTDRFQLDVDVAPLYGAEFAEPLRQAPSSVFVADGSEIAVYPGESFE